MDISQPQTRRSRGLWVHPEFRNLGISKILLNAVIDTAYTEYVWSVPKESALKAYESVGFVRKSEFFDTENGNNCIVILKRLDMNNKMCYLDNT